MVPVSRVRLPHAHAGVKRPTGWACPVPYAAKHIPPAPFSWSYTAPVSHPHRIFFPCWARNSTTFFISAQEWD
jgi:hypothetical protein